MVHLPETKKEFETFMQTGNRDIIYRNELDKACFQHDIAYDKSKDLTKRTQSDKVFRAKACKINGTEIIKFKAKDSENVATPLCLGIISKELSVANTKKLD